MFGRGIKLFTLFGFEVKIDASWLIIAVLVIFTLAKGIFPAMLEGLSPSTYWLMSIAGAIGLFLSIVIHEFFHSVVARKFGLPMKGITLFVFGGLAEMEEHPRNPGTEFFMAVAGPLSSIALGIIFYGVAAFLSGLQEPRTTLVVVSGYLAYINFILAAFNLVPAFPLDGGRILRSALWKWKNNLRWATRVASAIGSAFGLLLILIGILELFRGNPVGGIWLFLIGMFIRVASQVSYRQVLMQKMLEGENVSRFLKKDPVAVPSSTSIKQLLEEYFYKYQYKTFAVMDKEKLRGCINMSRVKDIPPERRSTMMVEELVQTCMPENTIPPSMDAMKALTQMDKTGNDKLLVVQDGRLEGIVTRNDILRFFAAKMEYGEVEK